MRAALLRAQIEQILPSAFTVHRREDRGSIPAGIVQIDEAVRGIPLRALTEICGSNLASSGKTSVLVSLLAQATRDRFCALVDAGDSFDPVSGQAAGIALPRLLWVRCGKNRGPQNGRFCRSGVENRVKLPPLEQAFKVADILLQSSGFGLIAVDLSGIPERIVRKVPLSSWFRFSRVIERQPAALVFIEQEPHATSCAGLVLRVTSDPAELSGNLFTHGTLKVEVVRGLGKKPAGSEKQGSLASYERNHSEVNNRPPGLKPGIDLECLRGPFGKLRAGSEGPLFHFNFSPCLRGSVTNPGLTNQWA